MVFHFEPKRKVYLVSMHLENRPGALGNLADILAVRGMNILEGFFGGMSHQDKATLSFFLETTNQRMDEAWLKDYIESSVYASDVEVKPQVEGLIVDSVNFPLTWNTGDRAVMMRIEGVREMIDTILGTQAESGASAVYDLGYNYGKEAWVNLVSTVQPKNKAILSEMLKIYSATGWGRPELVELDMGGNRAKVRLHDCFECASPQEGARSSNFVRGHIGGAFSAIFGSEVRASEPKCIGRGDGVCEFDVSR